jgi:hypothetical protein
MAPSQRLADLAPYARRLFEDDYVQDELDRLFKSVRDGSRRFRRKSAAEAATDPELRAKVMAALAAAAHIARALNEAPSTPPKRHRLRRLVLVIAVSGAAVAGYRQLTVAGSVKRDD